MFLRPRRSVVPSFSAVLRLEVEEKGEKILGNGWCWPGCHSIFETVGRQVFVTKVIFVCTDAELDKMSSIVCVAQVWHSLLARRKNREAGVPASK